MMVEDEDLFGDTGELSKLVRGGRDVDKRDHGVFAFIHPHAIFMTSRNKPARFSPDVSYGPNGAEPIRASRMIKADFLRQFMMSQFEPDSRVFTPYRVSYLRPDLGLTWVLPVDSMRPSITNIGGGERPV